MGSWPCSPLYPQRQITAPSSPLLDDVVELIVGLVVLQTLHRVPLTLPIGLSQLPDEHLGEEEETTDVGPGDPGHPFCVGGMLSFEGTPEASRSRPRLSDGTICPLGHLHGAVNPTQRTTLWTGERQQALRRADMEV